ncbi:hypothetical protein GYMLUDRAFT_252620, partial [Collybiopsis luxurians FD-317 M1]
ASLGSDDKVLVPDTPVNTNHATLADLEIALKRAQETNSKLSLLVGKLCKILECPICWDPAYQPYVLECGHLYCAKCLMEERERLKNHKDGFCCSLCKQATVRTPHPVIAVRHSTEAIAKSNGENIPDPTAYSWQPFRPVPHPIPRPVPHPVPHPQSSRVNRVLPINDTR